jgi:phosphoribosylamine---glycine ligase
MKVLVVGGGGREHALCWRLAQSPRVDELYAAPGNAGIDGLATAVPVAADAIGPLVDLVEREGIDLTVVGPEVPLVAGLADELEARRLQVFGPDRRAARLEGSKVWARELCERHGIPAPRSRAFSEPRPAIDYIDELDPPYVIKADGLAAGKGVTIAEDRATAEAAVADCLVARAFGDAGDTVLIEEFLEGFECSALALTDGRTVLPLALAQDYKRSEDGDRGPNTGGMGAFSPLPFVDPETESFIAKRILEATVAALQDEGIQYRGVVYAGLMITVEGPKVLEFNCRFGDPETQVILPRLRSDLLELLVACTDGSLGGHRLDWTHDACVGVVVAAGGYPGPVERGKPISGLGEADAAPGAQVFHAGTLARDGRVVTAGGRVVTVSALGSDHDEARRRVYEACSLIRFEGSRYRTDIARSVSKGGHGVE